MISDREIERAARTLAEKASSPAKVMLLGSYARGEAGPESDLDFLVVEKVLDGIIDEYGKLRRSLPDLGVSVDVIVISEERFEYWRDTYGTVAHAAASEGRLLAES